MNYFPDLLQTTALSFADPGNVFDMVVQDGKLSIRIVVGQDRGYEAILYFNGRLLVGFQEIVDGRNEKLDVVWEGASATATAANGHVHTWKADSNGNVVVWNIVGVNALGDNVVLRYLRNFYDEQGVLRKAIRYEENATECHRIYQFFEYGLDERTWKARKAWIYDYPYPIGIEEYYQVEIPVDIVEFPEDFEENAVEVRQVQ